MDGIYELQYLPYGDLQTWSTEERFYEKNKAIAAAEKLVHSEYPRIIKDVQVVYSETVYSMKKIQE
jgi:hypothetical protein